MPQLRARSLRLSQVPGVPARRVLGRTVHGEEERRREVRPEKPMSYGMRAVPAVVADAKAGEISGWSIATWLCQRHHPEDVRERLRALTKRGLIVMRPMDDPADEWRKRFPDRLKAMYSMVKRDVE
jgi:hypothetical protein